MVYRNNFDTWCVPCTAPRDKDKRRKAPRKQFGILSWKHLGIVLWKHVVYDLGNILEYY
jgi:hypothetical protein